MNELTLAVVGIDFPNADGSNRRFEAQLCAPGEPIVLRREPKNKVDPAAVAVFSVREQQIGYLSAERAPWIGRRLDAEQAIAVFQGLVGSVGYVRVAFGGRTPTLPASPRAGGNAREEGERDATFVDPDGPIWGA